MSKQQDERGQMVGLAENVPKKLAQKRDAEQQGAKDNADRSQRIMLTTAASPNH